MNVAEAYRRGRVAFMGLDLLVAPGALVPRAETELLGRCALDALAGIAAPRVIDMCCGAGNLACVIGTRRRDARVWAVDLSESCVQLARRNAASTGVADRVEVLGGDLFAPLAGRAPERSIDVVVCNPPYIPARRLSGDRAHLLASEPREAFDGGPYGLTLHQRVIREAIPFLRPGGALLVEVGAGQARAARRLFERARAYGPVRAWRDALGEERVVGAARAA